MTLSHHIEAEQLESYEQQLLLTKAKEFSDNKEEYIFKYSSSSNVPKTDIPSESCNGKLVHKYMNEELALDGIPTLNLASFVNTTIDDEPLKLVSENITKNLADNDEYPSLIEYQQRCITMLSNLWHAPKVASEVTGKEHVNTVGTATTGSSEAILLAGLAMKKSWQARRKAQGKSIAEPNILMASCAQVALEKFARYFDVENRTIHITEESGHLIDVSQIRDAIDENTIGIFVIMGSTFTGAFEPVEEIAQLLDDIEQETGIDVKIHVDGASGGFVVPFAYPHLKWDFEIDRVISINTSGHKFGLTSAGLGWVIWRDSKFLPDDLRFKLDYLGGIEETFTLNFSRPGFPVLHQYYNFLTFGKEGYSKIFSLCLQNSRLLSHMLEKSGYFECLSVVHKKIEPSQRSKFYTRKPDAALREFEKYVGVNEEFEPGLPIVAFRFSKEVRDKFPDIPQAILSLLLRNKGYIIPNYRLTPDEQDTEVLRVVVRDSLTLNLLEKLISELIQAIELLIKAVGTVHDVISNYQNPEEKKKVVYDLLLSIASNGVEEEKQIQIETFKAENKHQEEHKSYRGPC